MVTATSEEKVTAQTHLIVPIISIDFFDIWIDEIYIHQESKVNKFLAKDISNLEPFSYITIKFLYTTKLPVKKPEPLW